jgi:putative ABC transport system permease protein
MWKVTLKGIWAKKVRFLLTGIAVILGVAFVSGTFVLTATISKTFDGLFSDIYKNTDAVVRGRAQFDGAFDIGRGRIDASLLPVVRSADGVAGAAGTVQGFAVIVDKKNDAVGSTGNGAPNLGFAWIKDRELSSLHLVAGKGPRAPNEIVIDKKSADDAGYKPGDTVPVVTKTGRADYDLTGIVKFGDSNSLLGATITAFTPATAAKVLAVPGTYDNISVKAASGVSQQEVVRNIRATLQGDPQAKNVEVLTGNAVTTESQDNFKDQLSFFSTFLLVFGVIALLVGSFIIFNTFSIIVAQRGRELALLRALGAGQRQVINSVLVEAVLVGLTASIIGFVGGILLAGALKALLAGLGIDIPASSIVIPATAVIWSFVTGLVVTVIAAVAPALRASRIPPVAAMRDAEIDTSSTSSRRTWIGLGVTLFGVAVLLIGLFGIDELLWVGLGMVVVFLGVAVLGPRIAGPLSGALGLPIRRLKGITGELARENAQRNPKRTSATAAALMIGVALVGLITILGASIRSSVDASLDRSMKADYVVRSGGFGEGRIPVEAEQQLAAVPGVTSVSGVRTGAADVDGSVTQLSAVDPRNVNSVFDLNPSSGSISDLGVDGVAVQESTGKEVGDKIPIKFPSTGRKVFTVEAVFKQAGLAEYIISQDAYEQNYPDQLDSQIYVKIAGGATAKNTSALDTVVKQYPGIELETREEFKASQAASVNQLLNLIYVLLFFAIVIALFGIANTLGLSIIERTREIGLLRAVGMTQRQVRSSVRWESVIIALLGTILGLIIGVVFAWAVVRALNEDGIDQFSLAPAQLLLIVVLAALFGTIAAALPARRAAKLDILESIHSQ